MTTIARRASIWPIVGRRGGFILEIDGRVFPWHINREEAELVELAPGVHSLRIGILVDGPVTGVEEFNEFLLDETDRMRVRQADRHDSRLEGIWVYS